MTPEEEIVWAQQIEPFEDHVRQIIEDASDRGLDVEGMLRIQAWARSTVYTAVAVNERAYVNAGILVIEGTRADEFTRRLAPFNRILPGHLRSLAAYYFETEITVTE